MLLLLYGTYRAGNQRMMGSYTVLCSALADLGGRARCMPPHQWSRFFHFDNKIFEMSPPWESMPLRSTPPLREILDPPLFWTKILLKPKPPLEVSFLLIFSNYSCCVDPFKLLTYTIHIKRNPTFYDLVVVKPAVMLGTMTIFMFLMPPSPVDRYTYGKYWATLFALSCERPYLMTD